MELADEIKIRSLLESALQTLPQPDNTALAMFDEILGKLDELAAGSGGGIDAPGGGGSAPAAADDGCFVVDTISSTSLTLARCHYMVGGKCRTLQNGTVAIADNNVVALKIGTRSELTDTLATYSNLASLVQAQDDLDYYIVPLYEVAVADGEGSIAVDYRKMPSAAMWEG